jgi:hypothetical protein
MSLERRIFKLINLAENRKDISFFLIGLEGTYDEKTGIFTSLLNKDFTYYHTVKLDEAELQYFVSKYKPLYEKYLENEKQEKIKHYELEIEKIKNIINNIKQNG